MRVQNSLKNIAMGMITQIVVVLLGFLCRKTFLDSLGADYLGINGLLLNVLSVLSLVEGGIGGNIVYHLYKPLAERDEEKVTALIQLYKKLYAGIAVIVFLLSLGLYPFLGMVVDKSSPIPELTIVYFIFVTRNVISYLNSHKRGLINADQKGYLLSKYDLIFNVITTIMKIIVLQFTRNYILYLLIDLISFAISLLWCNKLIRKYYSYILTYKKYKVDQSVKSNLVLNFKAIMFHNIGGYLVTGTDNLLISGLVNMKSVGLYSNYTLIIGQLSGLLSPIIGGLGASIGNLIAVEGSEKNYEIFNVINLVNFWIYSFVTIVLYNLLEPFITWWIGEEYLLSNFVLIIILLNFYIGAMRGPVLNFKTKGAIFDQDKYCPLIEAIINLGASFILVKYFGLVGVFLGTTVSTLVIPFWTQPKLVYNILFERSVLIYFKRYFYYLILMILAGITTTYCCELVKINGFISLIIKGIICTIIPNILYLLLFLKTDEFKYIVSALLPYVRRYIPQKYLSKLVTLN
ncbi:Uncharacterised protein [Turicibacter sanguinis]|nr:Uncharacterised protein [Turicibacter sanguinis]